MNVIKIALLFTLIFVYGAVVAQPLTTSFQKYQRDHIDGDTIFTLRRLIPVDTLKLLGLDSTMFNVVQSILLFGDSTTRIPIVTIRNKEGLDTIFIRNRSFQPSKIFPNSKVNLNLKNAHIIRGGIRFEKTKIHSVNILNCTGWGVSSKKAIIENMTIRRCHFKQVNLHESKIEEISLRFDTIERSVRLLDNDFKSFFITDLYATGRTVEVKLREGCEGKVTLRNSSLLSTEQIFTGNNIHTYPFGNTLANNTFSGVTMFRNFHITDGTEATKTFYMSDLGFEKMLFEGVLPRRIRLRSLEIKTKLDFLKSYPGSISAIDIGENDINKISISPVNMSFFRTSAFDGVTEYSDKDRLQFMRINRSKVLSDYKRYLSILKMNSSDEDYKVLDLRYKKKQFFSKRYSSFWEGTYYIISKGWWNFGYSKGRILWWTPLLLFTFVCINFNFLQYLISQVYEIDKLRIKLSQLQAANALDLKAKMTVSLYYTCLIFFGLKLNSDNLTFNKFWPTLYIFVIYTSGLMCLAFAFNFIVST